MFENLINVDELTSLAVSNGVIVFCTVMYAGYLTMFLLFSRSLFRSFAHSSWTFGGTKIRRSVASAAKNPREEPNW